MFYCFCEGRKLDSTFPNKEFLHLEIFFFLSAGLLLQQTEENNMKNTSRIHCVLRSRAALALHVIIYSSKATAALSH